MGIEEEKFIIDLSDNKNTSQLAGRLSEILDTKNLSSTNIVLKLGNLNLKQSQLLSIKALIESIDSNIDSVYTTSEMTEASAVSLGLIVKTSEQANTYTVVEEDTFHDKIATHLEDLSNSFSTVTEPEKVESIEKDLDKEEPVSKEVDESVNEESILSNPEVQTALDKALGIEEDSSEISSIKENVTEKIDKIFNTEFNERSQTLAKESDYEETETVEESSQGKYVLLDTDGIVSEDADESEKNTTDLPTMYLYQTLRSGQTITHEGNIFIVGDTHPGSEVIATGDITVWGIIGGIVHAGSKGNRNAKVRALKLNPIQLRIAGLYSRRNDTVNVPYIQRSNEFTPEEARIENKQIVVYKTLRRED